MGEENMDVDTMMHAAPKAQQLEDDANYARDDNMTPPPPAPTAARETFRDIQVKVHIRRPERDSWMYLGRGIVTQEVTGHSSRVVVKSLSTGKKIVDFHEGSDLQAEKRGNFVVIGCVEGPRVISWSLNALNNSETLRLLASIELACYKCKQVLSDPRQHTKARRKIERVIKDDRRRRHRRRKDQEALIDAFAKQDISTDPMAIATEEPGPPPASAASVS